jgi:hypothetical protein
MAPPTDKPRLRDLDPEVVATEACDLLVRQLGRVAFALAPAIDQGALAGLDGPALARSTDIGIMVQQLTVYARDGAMGDWPDNGCAVDAVQSVCEVLYSQAGVVGTFGVGELADEADPETVLGLVVVAAMARAGLARGEALTARELAALASCSADHVRLVARQGGLRRGKNRQYSAPVCRTWLAGREVPGF